MLFLCQILILFPLSIGNPWLLHLGKFGKCYFWTDSQRSIIAWCCYRGLGIAYLYFWMCTIAWSCSTYVNNCLLCGQELWMRFFAESYKCEFCCKPPWLFGRNWWSRLLLKTRCVFDFRRIFMFAYLSWTDSSASLFVESGSQLDSRNPIEEVVNKIMCSTPGYVEPAIECTRLINFYESTDD